MPPELIVVPLRRIALRRVLERPNLPNRLVYCLSGTSQDQLDNPDKARLTSLRRVYATAKKTALCATL
jgi:hypothetical protein